jgi:hypothetical protein
MSSVPFTDDKGDPTQDAAGNTMQRPAGIDPHFYTAAGHADAEKYGSGTFVVNSLSNFRIGGPWDAQRVGKVWYRDYRSFANVAVACTRMLPD